jgi:GAF domain-containing protein
LAEPRKEHDIPPASVRFWEITLSERHAKILRILLHGVTTLGGMLLVFLLIRLIWQEPIAWSETQALYFAAYAVAVVITLIQWMFNSSLSRALREAEENHAGAVRSQTLLKERADELAKANALLQKRSLQLETAAEISQAAASVLDPDELVQHAVELVRERFDLYYVALFLVDEAGADGGGQWAVLRAGTGEAGRQTPAPGYRLKVGGTSTVGWCTANAQVRIAPDLGAKSRRSHVKINQPLPGTRSEAALPLRSRGRVIGALDVHSTEREAFSQEDIAVLQTAADQLAVAIDNAQLFAETRMRLEKMEARHRRTVRAQWSDSGSVRIAPGYERTRRGVTPVGSAKAPESFGAPSQAGLDETSASSAEPLSRAVEQVMTHQETVVQSDMSAGTGQAALVVPISLRGEVIGALGLHETEGGRQWAEDEIALVEAVADQMALALENARLLEETQQRARRDRLIADITARVRSSRDPETILRTAVRELGAALGTDRARVQIGTGIQPSDK